VLVLEAVAQRVAQTLWADFAARLRVDVHPLHQRAERLAACVRGGQARFARKLVAFDELRLLLSQLVEAPHRCPGSQTSL